MMAKVALLSLGGALGTLLRFLLQMASIHILGIAFPYGTILVNTLGCFAIGFIAASTQNVVLFHPALKFFLLVGVLGGFTTYSGFALETWTLAKDQELFKAAFNIFLHIFGCFAALVGGIWLARLV